MRVDFMNFVNLDKLSKINKEKIREKLKEYGINHATLELEDSCEKCSETDCHIKKNDDSSCHHHHHH